MLLGYFIVVFIFLLEGILFLIRKDNFTANLFLITSYFCIMFLATFRAPTFVTDDLNYLPVFWGKYSCYFEWGFCSILKLLQYIGNYLPIYFGILAALVFTPVWLFVRKYSCNVLFSILAFFCLMYAFNAVNVIRQFLALSLILFSFPFILKRRFWIFMCFVACASLFHSSAFICLSFYWLYTTKASTKNIVLLFAGSILVFLLFDHLASIYTNLGGEYAGYVTGNVETSHLSNVIRFILNLTITMASLSILKFTPTKILKLSRLNMQFLVLCSCIATSAAFIALNAYRAERIAYYFYLFNIITLPQIVESIGNKPLRYMIGLLVLVCTICYGATVLWSWQEKGMMYSFFWS